VPTPSNPSRAKSASRRARQKRVHGVQGKCKDCGTIDARVLVARSRPKLCQECKNRRDGRPVAEGHHPPGRENTVYEIPILVNSHRRLTDAQNDWDPETLTNPSGCPLRWAAAWIRGFVQTCKEMAEQFLLLIADLLETLSDWLREQLGEKWWEGTAMERYAVVRV
jgi:hypothetical protein